MDKQNITLSLSKDIFSKIEALALHKHISINEFLCESLKEKVKDASDYMIAKNRQLSLLEKGLILGTGGSLIISREELHARG